MHSFIPLTWPSPRRLAMLALTLVLRALLVNQLAVWLEGGALDQALHAGLVRVWGQPSAQWPNTRLPDVRVLQVAVHAPAPEAVQKLPRAQATRSVVY